MSISHLSALHLPHKTREDMFALRLAGSHPPPLLSQLIHARSRPTPQEAVTDPARKNFVSAKDLVTWASALPHPSDLAHPMPYGWWPASSCSTTSASVGWCGLRRTSLADLFSDRLASSWLFFVLNGLLHTLAFGRTLQRTKGYTQAESRWLQLLVDLIDNVASHTISSCLQLDWRTHCQKNLWN